MVVCKGVRINGIYVSNAEVTNNLGSHITSINPDATIRWHNKLAYVSVKGLLSDSVW